MNILVFGPGMEARFIPQFAFRPIDEERLTKLEIAVQRIGSEKYQRNVTIIGVPWVNPRGRGRTVASVSDYLEDPVCLYRALAVAFNAPRAPFPAAGSVVAATPPFEQEMATAKVWVTKKLSGCRIVWVILKANGMDETGLSDELYPLFT